MSTRVIPTSSSCYILADPRGPHVPARPVNLCARQPPAVSRSYTYKKITKPLLERRRRARMSKCLDELKALMVGPMRISEENLNRLEKADILEMAVQYLQSLASNIEPNRYQEGFNECAAEACHFLEKSPECDESLSERLVEHLETCTGPISIQVPSYRLTFSSNSSASCVQNRSSTSSPGLLMEVSRKRGATLMPCSDNSKVMKYQNPAYTPSSMSSPCTSSTYDNSSLDQENVWRPW